MCTVVSFKTENHYFGRNLDLDISYNESVTISPRAYEFNFTDGSMNNSHYAIIGMASVIDEYPLYFEASNEVGLSIAGLNFPNNAHYNDEIKGKDNVATYEFIPWLLCSCKTVDEVIKKCENLNLTNRAFSKDIKPAPLHFMVSDKNASVTIEQTVDGLKIYENPLGVMTNNPTFPIHMFHLNHYRHLTNVNPKNTFLENYELDEYCLGLGSLGLPGDLSSTSRFIRTVFTKEKSVCDSDELSSVSQFFHILESVFHVKGTSYVEKSGNYEITIYSSCINTDKGIYYYKTYGNSRISGVAMYKENLNSKKLISYQLELKQDIRMIN